MNDLIYLIKIMEFKRAAIVFFLDHNPQYENASYLKGQFDGLAQVIGEIERIQPGIFREATKPMEMVAPKWTQRDIESKKV
jgi:hypothetical protein